MAERSGRGGEDVRRSTRKALKGAELNLETYGHTVGTYGDQAVGFCLLGSVRETTRNPLTRRRAYRELHRAIAKQHVRGPLSGSIAQANDIYRWSRVAGERWALRVVRRALGEEP